MVGRRTHSQNRLNRAIELAFADDERDTVAMEPLYYPDSAYEAPTFPRGSSQAIPIDIMPVEHIEPIEHLLEPQVFEMVSLRPRAPLWMTATVISAASMTLGIILAMSLWR